MGEVSTLLASVGGRGPPCQIWCARWGPGTTRGQAALREGVSQQPWRGLWLPQTVMWAVPEGMCAGLLHPFSPFPGPFSILLSCAPAGPANGVPWAPLLSDLLAGLSTRRQEHRKERKRGCFCPAFFLLWHCFRRNLCSPPPPPWFQLSLPHPSGPAVVTAPHYPVWALNLPKPLRQCLHSGIFIHHVGQALFST